MKTIGFVKSKKENENRRALVFEDALKIKNKNKLFFETGYFEDFGILDDDVISKGFNVSSREEVLKCDVIIDPKIGDAEYLDNLNNQTIFGWIHATQNKDITDKIVNNQLTAYAFEKMFEENIHSFKDNNKIAGKAAVMHAMLCYGKLIENLNVAVIGNGNTSKGAQFILNKFNNNVDVYTRDKENLFKENFSKYDVIVNALLWDVSRTDHILYNSDLKQMKSGSLIIDISCDHNGAIESSHPTTLENPTYIVDNIMHYVVDHTPSLLYKDATISISNQVVKFVDLFIEDDEDKNEVLENCLIIKKGEIVDKEINIYQNR